MVTELARIETRWLSPEPLWAGLGDGSDPARRERFVQPAILRFDHDRFMEELLALLSYRPGSLDEWSAGPETWRSPLPRSSTAATLGIAEPVTELRRKRRRPEVPVAPSTGIGGSAGEAESAELKLYQASHKRHYLVTASLVCRRPGLPDRALDTASQERAAFVVRRLLLKGERSEPPNVADCDELAYVLTPQGGRWRLLSDSGLPRREELAPNEERLPMFGMGFEGERGERRRLLAGVVPVGRREDYFGARSWASAGEGGVGESDEATGSSDPRMVLLHHDVIGPWKALVEQAAIMRKQAESVAGEGADAVADTRKLLKLSRERIQTGSWYVLLDLVGYLRREIRPLWEFLIGERLRADLTPEQETLVALFESTAFTYMDRAALVADSAHGMDDVKATLRYALMAVASDAQLGEDLEVIEALYDRNVALSETLWPSFLFPLADPMFADRVSPLPDLGVAADGEPESSLARLDALAELVASALPAAATGVAAELPAPPAPLDTKEPGDGWFVLRCVYERPQCTGYVAPGAFGAPLVSAPTRPFRMAGFFDPDAPGRPIRIPMPVDVSPAGLRKFSRNTGFAISDMLCGKIAAMRKLTLGDLVRSVLPWPLHKDLPPVDSSPCKDSGDGGLGMFCSLSIPIVTLCAMILLFIMVALFDIFFRWIPYLFMCLPLPSLTGKKR